MPLSGNHQLGTNWLIYGWRHLIKKPSRRRDMLLRIDPDRRGVVNFDTVRMLKFAPLAVDFEVNEDDRIVWVLTVWHSI